MIALMENRRQIAPAVYLMRLDGIIHCPSVVICHGLGSTLDSQPMVAAISKDFIQIVFTVIL